MTPGKLVSVSGTGPVPHPGVILEVSSDGQRMKIATGSSKQRTYSPFRKVARGSSDANAAGFEFDTYFYGDRIRWFDRTLISRWNGKANNTLVSKLRYLEEEQAALDAATAIVSAPSIPSSVAEPPDSDPANALGASPQEDGE